MDTYILENFGEKEINDKRIEKVFLVSSREYRFTFRPKTDFWRIGLRFKHDSRAHIIQSLASAMIQTSLILKFVLGQLKMAHGLAPTFSNYSIIILFNCRIAYTGQISTPA